MKLFFSHSDILESVHRSYLSEWVKPLFPEPRHAIYGLDPKDLEYCKEQSEADAFLLPFNWNYYFEEGEVQDAMALIKEYQYWNKPIYTWAVGDYTLKIPIGEFILFRQSAYKSYRRKNEHACPVIIRDPLDYLNNSEIKILPKEEKPRIGFCGLAESNWIDGSLRAGKISMSKLINSISKPYLDLSTPISGTRIRRKVLKHLSSSNAIETDFQIRSSSGGQKINSNTYKQEFWKNMLESPYALCVRGTGNYSARFYEAMAMGRIPILVNTDCILPLDNEIDWKQHCIWVEVYELDNICDRINTFHRMLSNDDYEQLQIQNRKIWFDKMTFHGFFKSNMRKI